MDSKYDIHDANDSGEDDYLTSGDSYRDDDADDSDDESASLQQKNYTVLKEDDIRQRREDDITRISSVLSIPRDSACMLLHFFNGNVTNALESWFANEDKVRKDVGLSGNSNTKPTKSGELSCGICFESYPVDNITTAGCGHHFCNTCWTAYISTSINDGTPGLCMTLRCPSPSCGVAVCVDDMDKVLTSDEHKKKYRRYLVTYYVEHNTTIKWCPAPGCGCAIEFDLGSGGGYDVTCSCSYSFCWNCTKEAHRPVHCETASKWMMKNSSDAWLCLGQWSDHGESTGGFYACNRYESSMQQGAHDDESEGRREMAKKSVERYSHYYERWDSNEKSRQKALVDMELLKPAQLARLGEKLDLPQTELRFILEAWLQVVECRRVLKWTYVYGYYMPEQDVANIQFFNYLKGEAEAILEKLHHCAEKELHNAKREGEFNNFRWKLVSLTSAASNYFENLVRTLENGLPAGVDTHGATLEAKMKGFTLQ